MGNEYFTCTLDGDGLCEMAWEDNSVDVSRNWGGCDFANT